MRIKTMFSPPRKRRKTQSSGEFACVEMLTLLGLPTEVLLHILSFLDPDELNIIALTSQALGRLASDDALWREKLKNVLNLSTLPVDLKMESYKKTFFSQRPKSYAFLFGLRGTEFNPIDDLNRFTFRRQTLKGPFPTLQSVKNFYDFELEGRPASKYLEVEKQLVGYILEFSLSPPKLELLLRKGINSALRYCVKVHPDKFFKKKHPTAGAIKVVFQDHLFKRR